MQSTSHNRYTSETDGGFEPPVPPAYALSKRDNKGLCHYPVLQRYKSSGACCSHQQDHRTSTNHSTVGYFTITLPSKTNSEAPDLHSGLFGQVTLNQTRFVS